MQPYFFPYIGYFSLIKHTDAFILLDTVQYIYHGWIARNRILKPGEGWQYITVPLKKHSRDILIRDTEINNATPWREKIIGQLQHYKKTAPYFASVIALLQGVLFQDHKTIGNLNRAGLKVIGEFLKIDSPISLFSEMDKKIDSPKAPDEWALNICMAFGGVTEYWNPPGGESFFNPSKFLGKQIELRFQKVRCGEYNQHRSPFEPGLSILDVMMHNNVSEIHAMLDDYELF